jgi:hypothetical protein
LAHSRNAKIKVARDAAHALALVEHEPGRLGLEVVIESPARPAQQIVSTTDSPTFYPSRVT